MMDRSTVLLLLVSFVICCVGVVAQEDDPAEFQDAIWAWASHENKVLDSQEVSTCVGTHRDAKINMMQRSFPQAWPAKGSEDGFCGNMNQGVQALCNEEDLRFYLQFIFNARDPEEIPNRGTCSTDNSGLDGCQPGFFSYEGEVRPCCDGFFCPPMIACMIPCPLGASCVRAIPEKPPPRYGNGTWCAPYAYKTRDGKCGGADKWTVTPKKAFSTSDWTYGSGNLYCTRGHYCPNTFTKPVMCPKNHYCRTGSVKPTRCSALVKCKGGSHLPQADFTGFILLIFVFLFLAILWQAYRLRKLWVRRQYAKRLKKNQDEAGSSLSNRSRIDSSESTGYRAFLGEVWATMISGWPSVSRRKHMSPVSEPGDIYPSTDMGSQSDLSSSTARPILKEFPVGALSFAEQEHVSVGIEKEGLPVARVTIEFYGLNLLLKSHPKYVLKAASGILPDAKLTAIMGPSGAGKTSLLNALSGKAGYGTISGVILVNGEETTLGKYKGVMGFVPQDDIMHTDLTVQENLLFSARYRLPAGTSHSLRMSAVERALEVLGLNNVRHEVVGGQMNRGISGGQRKRVNVGLEIVADPLVLFLDEPTSGLDSSSCKQVVSALRTIAHLGVTTAAIVHQPSHMVMRLFDNLLLLGNGGTTVYNGPEKMVQDYFESLGFQFPSQANAADIVMDITTGQHRLPGRPDFKPEDLFELWRDSEKFEKQLTNPQLARQTSIVSMQLASLPEKTVDENGDPIQDPDSKSIGLMKGSSTKKAFNNMVNVALGARMWMQKAIKRGESGQYLNLGETLVIYKQRKTPNFFHQFWWCLFRALLQTFRAPFQLFIEYFTFAAAGTALGYVAETRKSDGLITFQKDTVYNFIAIGLLSSISGLRAFGLSREIFYRESASGINRFAFFLALDLVGMMKTILHALCYLLPYYYFSLPHSSFGWTYFVVVSLMYSWKGSAYITSQLLGYASSQLTSAVLVLLYSLLSRPKEAHGLFKLRYVLFTWWALKAMVITEASCLSGVWLMERCTVLEVEGFEVNSYGWAMFLLIILGVLARIVACGLIFVVNRGKQL